MGRFGYSQASSNLLYKSYAYSSRVAASGIEYVGGFYLAPATEIELNQGSLTQAYGTANVSYAAHVFAVAKAAGTTDGSDLVLTISGTSITDLGVLTPGDSEILVADATAAVLDQYFETTKKWVGTVTYTISSTAGTTYAFTFNYGFCKYDTFDDRKVTVSSFDLAGLCETTDANFDVELIKHADTGWTYDAAAFVPGATASSILSTNHGAGSELTAGHGFSFKDVGLNLSVDGANSEGTLIRVTTSANKAVAFMNAQLGYVL